MRSKVDLALEFFTSLRHTKGRFYGMPFDLLPWQEQILRDVYGTLKADGTRQYKYIYIEIPKKNGKSELAAAAGLFHTFMDGEMNGEVYGCAADRDQARIVFDVAVDMIDQIPALAKRTKLTKSMHMLEDRKTGTIYKVVSAEAYSKHGLNISACIFDELHAQPTPDLWNVMTFGAGDARTQPIWWVITTAGDDPDRVSIGWEKHEYATKILNGEIADRTWYPVVYNYDGDDIYNPTNWAIANPSLGQTFTLESVQEMADRAMNDPAQERLFRWLRLNQWVTTKLTSWLPLSLYDKTVGTWNRNDLQGRSCFLGLDLSSTTDLTSACLLFPPQGKQLDWRCIWENWIPEDSLVERVKTDHVPYDKWAQLSWVTPTKGTVIDYTLVEKRIIELSQQYKIIEIDSDRAMATMLLQRLENMGFTCVDIPQTFLSMSDAINQVEILLKGEGNVDDVSTDDKDEDDGRPVLSKMLNGTLTHEPNPAVRWCFGNASTARNGQGYVKLVKESKGKNVLRTKRIDPIIALINAMVRARFTSISVDISDKILDEEWGM